MPRGKGAESPKRETNEDLRRTPLQSRSQLKVKQILECANRLVIDGDPEAVSTTTIAAAANVSVGYIYRYFPDKEAIFEQILVESLNRLDEHLAAVNFSLDVEDWRVAVEQGIDAIIQFVADDAAFRKLWFSSTLTSNMVEANRVHDTNLAKQLANGLPARRASARGRDPVIVGEMFFGIIDKGVDLAFRGGSATGDPAIVAEVKIAAVSYLETYLQ